MSKNSLIEINLDFNCEIYTNTSAAELIVAILEYLLFQRHQIPFIYPTFKYLLSKLNQEKVDELSYMIQKQRQMAMATYDAINNIESSIFEEFKQRNILTARFLFGATPLTPREAYIIKLPHLSNCHSPQNHCNTHQQSIKKILMSLLTSQSLYEVFSNNMPPTNMFIDLETKSNTNLSSVNNKEFYEKEYNELPYRCKTIVININLKSKSIDNVSCCQDIEIFEELENLSISDDIQDSQMTEEGTTMWLEAKSFVKGFKDTLVNGKSIWKI